MIDKQQYEVIVARLNGMASEAEMKRVHADLLDNTAQERRYYGEQQGLLKALDLLQHNGHGEAPSTKKEEVMGNGCE
jgi:hypothetical protein